MIQILQLHSSGLSLDDLFPVHMNRLWMKKYHGTDEHWHWHDFYEISYIYAVVQQGLLYLDVLFNENISVQDVASETSLYETG